MEFVLFLSNALPNQHGDVESYPGPSSFGEANLFFSDMTDSIYSCGLFKFIHLNVRSLLPNIEQIYLEFNNFDIIALTETF